MRAAFVCAETSMRGPRRAQRGREGGISVQLPYIMYCIIQSTLRTHHLHMGLFPLNPISICICLICALRRTSSAPAELGLRRSCRIAPTVPPVKTCRFAAIDDNDFNEDDRFMEPCPPRLPRFCRVATFGVPALFWRWGTSDCSRPCE